MSNGARDNDDRDLYAGDLQRLFLDELSELEGHSCQRLLIDFLEEEWQRLVMHSAKRAGMRKPNADDAVLAFESIKYTLTSNKDAFPLLDFTWPEFRRMLRRVSLRYWYLRFWYLIASGFFAFIVVFLWFTFKLGVAVGNAGIEL